MLLSHEAEDQLKEKARKQFFALGKELGYESLLLKERAKKYFRVKSFNDLGVKEIDSLINKLKTVKENI